MGILDFWKRKKNLTCDPSKNPLKEEDGIFGPIEKLKDKAAKSYPKAIRMIYVGLHQYKSAWDGEQRLGEHYNRCSPYTPPEKMSLNDICKVVSYLSDYIEETFDIEPASQESVVRTSTTLEQFGFTKIPTNDRGYTHITSDYYMGRKLIRNDKRSPIPAIDGVVDLFTVEGFDYFKNSDLYERYFNWYEEATSQEEIQAIYDKLGLDIQIPRIEDKTM